jgi:hypothetical protein
MIDNHCGSIEIDFVLDPRLTDLRVYETISFMIERRGYKPYETKSGEALPYRFYRSMRSPMDGRSYTIEVDFITEPHVAEKLHPSMFLAVQRDLQAVIIPGSSIAFSHNLKHPNERILPSGAESRATGKIADLVGCIATKVLALRER